MNSRIWILNTTVLCGIFVSANSKYNPWDVHKPRLSVTLTHVNDKLKSSKVPIVYAQKNKKILLACKSNIFSEVIWKHNKKNLNIPPPYEIPWEKGGILLIYLIPGRTDGLYECIVNSRYRNEVIVKKVKVVILEEHQLPVGFPQIITHPSNINTFRRQVDFHCVVSGESPIQIIWYKDRKPVVSDRNHQTSISMVGQHFSSNLMINNVSNDDKGFYQCVAINSYGQAVSRQANINCEVRRKRRVRRSAVSNTKGMLVGPLPLEPKDKEQCAADDGALEQPGDIIFEPPFCATTPDLGDHMDLKWKVVSRNISITGFAIVLYANVSDYGHTKQNQHCFNLENDKRSFIFAEKDGFSKYNQYEYLISARPIPVKHNQTLKPIDKKECFNPKQITTGKPSKASSDNKKKDGANSETVILICTIGAFIGLFLFILTLVFKRKHNTSLHLTFQADGDTRTGIYISYCGIRQDDLIKVHKLAQNLNLENVSLNVDFLCETRIADAGGFPFWMKGEMQRADRIIIFITSDYIKAITTEDNDEERPFNEQIIKVRNESRNIVEREYFSTSTSERSKVLFILDHNVKEHDLPIHFKNRIMYSFPKDFSENDEDFQKILGRLFNFERMVLQNNNNNNEMGQERTQRKFFGCF